MNKRKGVLDCLKLIPALAKEYSKLIEKMLDFFTIYDLARETNEHVIFYDLYFRGKNNSSVAMCNSISLPTLQRYIRCYEKLAGKIIMEYQDFIVLRQHLDK